MEPRKPRRKFSLEQKKKAVDDYVAGVKPAAEIASELGITTQLLYSWRVQADDTKRDSRVSELTTTGLDPAAARRMQLMEEEIAHYQKKVAEQAVMIDLLKKLRGLKTCQPESELSGLIATTKKLDRKSGRVK